MAANSSNSLEWFGITTFRLRTHGITIFLDTWLDRPSTLKQYLSTDDVDECDYIFISHAHFDHLPGADRIARKTGAIIYANSEAINIMRTAGVPEEQLIPVQGGERIPLFTKAQRDVAVADHRAKGAGHPGVPDTPGPPRPDVSTAPISVHVWPSLHVFGPPGDHSKFPDTMDTAQEYHGVASPYACTLDINEAQRWGLFQAVKRPPPPPEILARMPPGFAAFIEYLRDQERNRCSPNDGGQLMYNFILGEKTLLWMAHLGGYDGVLKGLQPRPDLVIMAIAGRPNLNGRPFDGSAAQFATQVLKWLGEPDSVVWCLYDECPIPPRRIITTAATTRVQQETRSRVWHLEHAKKVELWSEVGDVKEKSSVRP